VHCPIMRRARQVERKRKHRLLNQLQHSVAAIDPSARPFITHMQRHSHCGQFSCSSLVQIICISPVRRSALENIVLADLITSPPTHLCVHPQPFYPHSRWTTLTLNCNSNSPCIRYDTDTGCLTSCEPCFHRPAVRRYL
jgi:hypothetical protein